MSEEADKIARLESELREARAEHAEGVVMYNALAESHAALAAEHERVLAALSAERTARRVMREALRQVAEHPHCVYGPSAGEGLQYAIGVADGHRCAATCARAALAAEPGEGAATPESAYWCARCDHQRSVHSTVPCHGIYLDAARPSTKCDCVAFVETLPPEGHPRAAEVKNG